MGNFDELKNWELPVETVHKRYTIGNTTDTFEEVKNLRPVFSFDYISFKSSDYCFNSQLLGRKDFVNLLSGLKRISENTYSTLNAEPSFHFHDINWAEVNISESDFYKCIHGDKEQEHNLIPYQFKLFQEARIIGFIYKGVFYLVMFDRGHNAYDRDRSKDKKKKGKKKK